MRLIDADALEKRCFKMHGYGDAKFLALGNIRTAPTIEAEPVKHGRWEDFSSIWECDQCHKWFSLEQGTADMNYCPNCGAKMDGGAER